MHIADIDLVAFYSSAFPAAEVAHAFVQRVESLDGPHPGKLAFHQGARMVWLSDRIDDFARGRPALLILFYLIAAEAVAKIVFNFHGEGQSRAHVKRFFGEVCSQEHRDALAQAFVPFGGPAALSWEQAVDLLYDVRCDVVHEARYFEFHLAEEHGQLQTMTTWNAAQLVVRITPTELRQIVLEGVVLGVRRLV